MTRDHLIHAGFQRLRCSDGWFWVIERGPGRVSEQIFRICAQCMGKRVVGDIQHGIVLQCRADYTAPMLYCDSKLWKLTHQQFEQIVSALGQRPF